MNDHNLDFGIACCNRLLDNEVAKSVLNSYYITHNDHSLKYLSTRENKILTCFLLTTRIHSQDKKLSNERLKFDLNTKYVNTEIKNLSHKLHVIQC